MVSSNAMPPFDETLNTIKKSIKNNWNLFFIQGIILVICGLIAIIWPQSSTIAVDVYVGTLFTLSGFIGLFISFYAPTTSDFIWALLSAALSLFVGILLLWHPALGAVSLTFILIALFITEGIAQITTSLRYRSMLPDSWIWLLISGVTDLVLALIVIGGMPNTATWTLGLLAGINLISTGAAIIVVALSVRRAAADLKQTFN